MQHGEARQPEDAGPAARILDTARLRLAVGGFGDLTLRPLAEASGTTMAALTYHLGSKAQIIAQLVEQERAADLQRHSAFAARYALAPQLQAGAVAAILEDYIDEAVGPARIASLIWMDLLLRASGDLEVRALLAPWLAERWAFWTELFAGRIEDSARWAEAAFGYVTDETVHSLAQDDEPDYRLLRRMAIERLASRGARRELSDPTLFEAVVRRLDPSLEMPAANSAGDPFPGRAAEIARAAGEVIVAEGAEAATHRAVGVRAQTPASSVAYHFRTHMDLVRAGLTVIYLVAQGRLAPREGPSEGFVARGTASVALAAARDPELRPFAVDVRRLRGENLRRRLAERLGERPGLDACMAQAMSITRLGFALLTAAAGARRDAVDWPVQWLLGPGDR